MRTKMRTMLLAGTALALVLGTAPAAADEPTVWLRIETSEGLHGDLPRVKVHVPLSLIEVVIESLDSGDILREIQFEKGIDLAKLWRELRSADTDEFVIIEVDGDHVKVYKDRDSMRVTIQEDGYREPNINVRIPFAVVDFLLDNEGREFRLSEIVKAVRGELPLVLVEATRDEGTVKVWLEAD